MTLLTQRHLGCWQCDICRREVWWVGVPPGWARHPDQTHMCDRCYATKQKEEK